MNSKDVKDALDAHEQGKQSTKIKNGIGCFSVVLAAIVGAGVGGWGGFFVFLIVAGVLVAIVEKLSPAGHAAKRSQQVTGKPAPYSAPPPIVSSRAAYEVLEPTAPPDVLGPPALLAPPQRTQWIKGIPVFTADMITPHDKLLTSAEVARLLKAFLVDHAKHNAQDAKDLTDELIDSLQSKAEELRDDILEVRARISGAAESVAALKEKVASARAANDLVAWEVGTDELEDKLDDLSRDRQELKDYQAESMALRQDKRAFLVEFVNLHLHGNSSP